MMSKSRDHIETYLIQQTMTLEVELLISGYQHQMEALRDPDFLSLNSDIPVSYTHLTLPTILRV